MADLLWKECAEWLVLCHVLPPDHRVKWRNAQVIDLANTLRDGVLLCHLLNNLSPGCVDLKEINLRPQMSQFLCLKNIRSFLHACQKIFELKSSDVFEPHMLFDYTDFGQVLHTLSKLSNSPKALLSGKRGFPSYSRPPTDHEYYNDDIYRNLEDQANDDYEDNYKYDEIGADARQQQDEEGIYEDLCSFRKENEIPVLPQAPVEKRVYCFRELVETEQNYIAVLNGILGMFIRPLMSSIKPEDRKIVFMGIQEMTEIHTGFHSDLLKAFSGNGTMKLSDCFLHWKDRLVIYGEYCSNLPQAQELIDDLCYKSDLINQAVLRCQMKYNEGKFKLRDLLSVPMQRVLKYHLFLVELRKNTPESHEDYVGLERALDAMLDLSQYINEVKRDNETLQIIRDIQKHINDLVMPENLELKDYGRLLRDGELKIRSHCDSNKLKNRYVFIFDRVLLVCKATRGEQYSFKDALSLRDYKIDDSSSTSKTLGKDKWSHNWFLVHRENKTAYTMHAKTEEMKFKWVEAFKTALDNITPVECSSTDHMFNMHNFDQPSNCDYCQKLLRGVFYQGYRCITCTMQVHKGCIGFVRSCGAPSLPPRPTPIDPENPVDRMVATRSYYPNLPGHLSLEQNDVVYIINRANPTYWYGKLRRTGQEGLFPVEYMEYPSRRSTVYVEGTASTPVLSPVSAVSPLAPKPKNPENQVNPGHLEEYNWFAGMLDHDAATSCIEQLSNGAFLVRISKRQNGKFVITLKHDDKAKHMKVCMSDDEFYYLSESKYFKTIVLIRVFTGGRGSRKDQNIIKAWADLDDSLADSLSKNLRNDKELVRWYAENSLSDCFNGLDITLARPYKELLNGPEVISYAIANYDFSATSSSMLSLKKGDRVAILSKRGGDKGWWKGRIEPRIGYFPLAYVTEESV